MSWQEELRKLDEELASGRLSADDYRVRRDQVLSSAVSHSENTAQQPEPDNSADSTQVIAPVSPPQGVPQQAPPDLSAEPTQAVSPNWQAHPPVDPERTQYVPSPSPPAGFPTAPPGGFPQSGPQPVQPAWHAPQSDVSPPWGGSDFPPIGPVGQGPESFDSKPGKGKIAWISVAAVVVLVAAGLTIFLTTSGGDSQAGPTPTQAPPTSSTSNSPNQALLDKIPPTEGAADGQSGVLPVNRLVELGIVDSGEAALLSTHSVPEVAWRGSQRSPDDKGPGNEKISVTVIPLDSPTTANALAGEMRQYYVRNGLVLLVDALPDMPPQVAFHKLVASPVVYRGTWVSGSNVVRVNVIQGNLADENALSGAYQRTVHTMLLSNPAS
ncbi:hypothetical protein [Amycolatopsis viridis]|uniref:Flagellar basal body-associated protein FliL n=1 Tax=Amycolatopsis viridis TaxID=185678 RepID=A0ABX0SPF8_9PSEU|nr:hypothetical protein [Amycolatopsis viridis]NIH77549.1 hypothetical protein [Amycolatopsis viridis]